jgi:hypothetical protein
VPGRQITAKVRALSVEIAHQLEELDGLCLDNVPERHRLARWIAATLAVTSLAILFASRHVTHGHR